MNRENVRAPETVVRLLLMVSAVMVVLLTLDQLRLFGRPLLDDIVVLETHFYYALLGLLLPFAFLQLLPFLQLLLLAWHFFF